MTVSVSTGSSNPHYRRLVAVLERHMGSLIAGVVVDRACRRCAMVPADIQPRDLPGLLAALRRGVGLFGGSATAKARCLADLAKQDDGHETPLGPVEVAIKDEFDVADARCRARDFCAQVGFSRVDQIRVGTVVSELSRNIVMYAGTGRVNLTPIQAAAPGIEIVAEDHGPGIPNIDEILTGSYRSRRGLGQGLCLTRKLMDQFEIVCGSGRGTRIRATKFLRETP